jgi:N-acetylglucosaminyl-diphospho-decaprenol L-rhamnosyltransferase
MTTSISLSVVTVAHNSVGDLQRVLPALLDQLGDADELIIVDNASGDALQTAMPQLAPSARVITLQTNVGFAAAANAGAASARGDLLVLINPDATVQPGWAAAIREPWGGPLSAWMPLVLLDDARSINTSGGVVHFTGISWAGQVGMSVSHAPQLPTDVGFVSGACLAIPRSLWNELGGFADHFFMYCEDLDLSLRLHLRGHRVGVMPGARITHDYEFHKGDYKWRLLERNRWATLIRTYPSPLLVGIAPALAATEFAVWSVAFRGHWARAKAHATFDVLRSLPSLLRERRPIQSTARVSASDFAAHLVFELDSPYLQGAGDKRWLRVGLLVYWRVVQGMLRLGSRRHRTGPATTE